MSRRIFVEEQRKEALLILDIGGSLERYDWKFTLSAEELSLGVETALEWLERSFTTRGATLLRDEHPDGSVTIDFRIK